MLLSSEVVVGYVKVYIVYRLSDEGWGGGKDGRRVGGGGVLG